MNSDDRTAQTSRVLPFTPDAVYRAFAEARLLAQWWGPEGFTNTFAAFDFRVGGRWLFTMHGPDGKAYANENVFLVLESERRIVVRHDCPPFFTLTVTLTPLEQGTLLDWRQTFDDEGTARAVMPVVIPANEQNLDRLRRVLESMPGDT